jgi:hypothetical protein
MDLGDHSLLGIRDEEESLERKEHIAARSWLELLHEHGTKIGDELLTVSLAGKSVKPRPQTGATVPVDDFIDAGQEMEVLGCPNVQLTHMRRENVVVELCRMNMPLTRSAHESILPSRRTSEVPHRAMCRRVEVGWNLHG